MENEKYTEEFQKAINDYVKLGFNQDECNGFMHGFNKGAEAQKLNSQDEFSKDEEKRVEYNAKLISSFIDHVKQESGHIIKETTFESFFNA